MEEKARDNDNPLSSFFTNKELEVCDILLQLPSLILQSETSRYTFKVRWGVTKKRILIRPSQPAIDHEEASQSETPLISSLPIEAHERPRNLKRKREDLSDIINDLTKHRESFKKEIAGVKSHNERRRIEQDDDDDCVIVEFKERKQESMSCCNVPDLPIGIPDLNVPLIEEDKEDDCVIVEEDNDCVIVDSAQGFDLNVPLEVEEENIVRVEPTQVLDQDVANKVLIMAMAAEARKRRMRIYRVKNLFAANRPRYPKLVYG
uniref:Uncharacterized protein n=1 Tax=Fagus sylvatica TaxID=28930 RepID=A0A2N9IQJ4_FAGSY